MNACNALLALLLWAQRSYAGVRSPERRHEEEPHETLGRGDRVYPRDLARELVERWRRSDTEQSNPDRPAAHRHAAVQSIMPRLSYETADGETALWPTHLTEFRRRQCGGDERAHQQRHSSHARF